MTDGSTGGRTGGHVEPGGSWRPFWLVGAGLVALLVLDAALSVGRSLPKGRAGLPLRLTDGRTVLVPTRDPAALAAAVLAGIGGRSGDTPRAAQLRGGH